MVHAQQSASIVTKRAFLFRLECTPSIAGTVAIRGGNKPPTTHNQSLRIFFAVMWAKKQKLTSV